MAKTKRKGPTAKAIEPFPHSPAPGVHNSGVTACYNSPVSLVKRIGNQLDVRRARCKCWACPACFKVNAARLKSLGFRGRPNKFLTLTVNPAWGRSPEFRARQLVEAWRILRRAIARKFNGQNVQFLSVFEKTKAGEPHLHILCRMKYVPQKFLSNFMLHRMLAPIVDVRRIRSKRQVAGYVAKYLSKCPERFKGTKRYWRSMRWIEEDPRGSTAKKKEKTGYRAFFTPFERLRKDLEKFKTLIHSTVDHLLALLPPRLAFLYDPSFNTS